MGDAKVEAHARGILARPGGEQLGAGLSSACGPPAARATLRPACATRSSSAETSTRSSASRINNLVDLIIIVTVGRTLLQLPDALLFGRILPGAGLSLLVGNLYYARQARLLAEAEGRDDVTAQPFGLNTPTVFLFLYLVMYPVYVRTKDPELAWKVGVAACFLSGVIEAAGAFVGRVGPTRHAALGPPGDPGGGVTRLHRPAPDARPVRATRWSAWCPWP